MPLSEAVMSCREQGQATEGEFTYTTLGKGAWGVREAADQSTEELQSGSSAPVYGWWEGGLVEGAPQQAARQWE